MPDISTSTIEVMVTLSASAESVAATVILGANVDVAVQFDAEFDGERGTLPAATAVERQDRVPIHQSDRSAGIILAAHAERVDDRRVRVRFDDISPADRDAILELWRSGRATVRPFELQVAGEKGTRKFVFARSGLRQRQSTAARHELEVELIDVGTVVR